MTIDTHQHVFWHGRDDAGLVADMDEHGIDLAWLLSWEIAPDEDNLAYHRIHDPRYMRPDGTHAGIPLANLVSTRDRYPQRFILGYCPHPRLGDAPALLEAAHAIHGARVCGEWKFRLLFDDPRCLNLFHKAGALNMPVVLHLDVPYRRDPQSDEPTYDPAWYGGTVANLERALIACPDTVFIGHAPGFWREISGDADAEPSPYPKGPVTPGGRLDRLFQTYPNLYADLSAGSGRGALGRDREHALAFIERWQDRLLFARDHYGGNLMDLLDTLDLAPPVREKLLSTNAQRLAPIE